MLIRGFNFYTLRPPPRTGFFNIFHPFDPLGYRMEPMIDSDFYDVKPVRVERLARRRILPVPLPRIPNLGIKSSIGAAAPLIWQARRTFFRYMMTREGRLIVDSGVTQRTVVETVVDGHAGDDEGGEGGEDDDSDELEVRSEDGCREIEGTEEFSRSYDSLPETRDAAGTLRRPTLKKGSMSIRRASRGRIPAALRRRSSELMGSDESLDEEETWVNGEAAKVLYEEEEERVWTEETPVEAATWSRRWMGGGADGGAEKRRSYWYGGWTRRRSSTKIINGAAAVTTDGDNDAEAADQEEERDDEGDDEGEASLEEEEAMAWNIAKLVDSAGQEGQDGFEELLGDAVKSSVQPADAPQRRSTILGMAGSVAGSVASVAGSAASAALSVIGLSQPNSSETNIAKGPRVVPQPSTSSPAALGRKQKPRRSTKLSQERHGLSDSELAKVVGERPDVERADNASPDLLDGEEAAIEPPRTNNELTEVKLLDTDGDAVDSTDPVAPVNPVDSVNPVDPASPSVIPILETQLVLTPERTSSSETLVAEPTPERTSSSEILVAEPEVMDKESLGDILVTPSTPLVEYIDPIVTAHPHTKNLLSADNADVVSLAESDSSYATATSMDGHHEDILDAVPSSPDSGRTAMGSDDEMTLAKRSRSDDELSIGSGGAGALVLDGKDGRTYSRVDYVLTEGVVDAYASEWIVAMKSHFRYWANNDGRLSDDSGEGLDISPFNQKEYDRRGGYTGEA
ncbi:hypothetical protein BC937DRAFT_94102 [Endogone sp. FLAS-F59071]|nr:hypothetical protein BC937DRAFT_94102 [Endogone sp. FLAS-F59071]|eukprot:RUS14252.1 hypothetical protein BC937DRAFT_94102 [Endogone sp. FLAS-F59071]